MTSRHLFAPARLAGSRLLATQSDERLVDLTRAGSEPAFEAIVTRYRAALLRYCSSLLGRERAEDAVQQTFVKAYDAMQRDDRPLLLKPWLYRIAHNTSHNALRDHALRHEELDEAGATAERPELQLERREQLRSVLASVQGLPARQRDALVLRELEGRSYDEIAAALGVGGGAVRQLLNRARTTVRTAATAVTPVGLLLRLPAAGSGAGESVAARIAELTGAAGAGAVASKLAATALVTGALVGGAAVAPLGDLDGTTAQGGTPARAQAQGADTAPSTVGSAAGAPASRGVAGGSSKRWDDGSGPGFGGERGGSGRRGGGDHSSGPGSGDGTGGSNSGPGSGSPPSSESSGSGSSGSGSGFSGSGSSGSGSGSSGSGSSGSGSSGSGSGSGSSGPGPSGSGSGSSGSGSSGSGSGSTDSSGSASDSSGSGSSGSGSGSGTSGSGSDSSGSGTSDPALGAAESSSGSSGSGSGSSGTAPLPTTSGSGSSGSP